MNIIMTDARGKDESGFSERHKQKVLQHIRIDKKPNLMINKLVSDSWFVYEETKILDLYDDLLQQDSIQVIGVVNHEERCLGIIVKKELSMLLSRPYARDVMKKRLVNEVMQEAEMFHCDMNVFTISEIIKHKLRAAEVFYFLLIDHDARFKGIFSTRDMLIYLSDITQCDIILARKMQARLVKESDLITGRNFEFVSVAISAMGVAGDFYTVKKYSTFNWLFSVCDVSGKGIAASIITSVVLGMMNIYDFKNGLGEFIRQINKYLFQFFESEKFITGIFLNYNDEKRQLHICDLGHSYICIFRNNRCIGIHKNFSNLPIGILPDIVPRMSVYKPEDGDILFIYTDGLIDQKNIQEMNYPIERVYNIINTNSAYGVERIKELILKDFNLFRNDRNLNDDITFTIMKFERQEVII